MNIFMILCDELRADALGYMGNATVKTPNLDALAEDSVVFTNAYCNTPMCVPSRNSIATGRYAHSHGALDNMLSPLEGEVSFYSILQKAGYRTFNHGKWHCNIDPLKYGMHASAEAGQDLTETEQSITCFGITDPDLRKKVDHKRNLGEVPLIISGKRPGHKDDAMDSVVTRHFLAELDIINPDAGPVFGRLSIMDPHTPYIPSEPYASMYDPSRLAMPSSMKEDLSDKPVLHSYFRKVRGFETLTEEDYRKSKAAYYGLVSHVDERVGQTIAKLKALDLYDDALILFVADHGSMMGEHGFIEKWGHMYEPVMKIPFMMKMPQSVYAGKRLDSLVESIDFMPTIMDMLEFPVAEKVHGKSLMPYIAGEADSHKDQVYAQYYCGSLQNQSALMIRDGRWKLTSYPEGNKLEEFLPRDHHLRCSDLFTKDYPLGELYDLEKDPEELDNLFDHAQFLDRKKTLLAKLETWKKSMTDRVKTATMPEGCPMSLHWMKQGENMLKAQTAYEGKQRWGKLSRIKSSSVEGGF